ncbi:putative ribonuclease H-like domain-containing protein [Tanacetum coccineum]
MITSLQLLDMEIMFKAILLYATCTMWKAFDTIFSRLDNFVMEILKKSKKSTFPSKLVPSTYFKLELLHMDLCGPMRVETVNKKQYILANVLKVRSDNGTEFKNATLKSFYEKQGIMHHMSIAQTPQQNGVVECRNHTLVEAARTMLDSSDEMDETPTHQDLYNLFGPLYEEYYAPRTPKVSDNSTANTLDNEDTPLSSSILVDDNDAP